jgi:heme/flavin dehydrogenase (mycofactocin system)
MAWFESVAEAQRRARRVLPKSVYKAIMAGAERGQTYQDNLDAFAEIGFAPHVAGGAAERRQSTTVMGVDVSLPVLLSPTGVQAVHPEGEVAVARAAATRDAAMGLSGFASKPIEEVVAANPKTFAQLYWAGSREAIEARVARARAAGARGLIVTLDWTFSHSRDWGSPVIPSALDLKTMVDFAPEVLVRPRWLARWLQAGHLPELEVPNVEGAPGFFAAYGEWMGTPPPSWEDLAWLRSLWPEAPFMLKGIMRVDDARRARDDVGATAISVSNHGGNNLDGTPASIRALAAVVEAVPELEVLLDGGVRRGSDAVKALALGARAVMIGRPYLWGLAAEGQAGVENVLDVMRLGIDSALLGLGRASIDELDPSDLLIPDAFHRRLG